MSIVEYTHQIVTLFVSVKMWHVPLDAFALPSPATNLDYMVSKIDICIAFAFLANCLQKLYSRGQTQVRF